MKTSILTLAALAVAAPALQAQITMRPLTTINLDSTANASNPEYIGTNPSCMSWDGRDLFVGGFNSSGATGTTGLVKISDALNAATINPAFVQYATPALRGFSGLALSGRRLAAAFDSGGNDPNGITAWDLNGGQLWAKTARGGSGVGFDPGFGGVDSGVAWTTFGSGRRALQDVVNGSDLYTTSNGMIILTSEGTFWRDIDFDIGTGDVYLREGNNVIKWTRNGGNSVTNGTLLFDPADADFVNSQNLEYFLVDAYQLVIFNDRSTTAGGQSFTNVVKVIDGNGNPVVVDWSGFAPADGVGAYDFSYDDLTGTLALLDYSNRDVTIFQVEASCSLLQAVGDGSPGSTLTYSLSGAAANAPAALVLAASTGATSFPIGALGTLELGLAQPLVILGIGNTDAFGAASIGLTVPSISPRVDLPSQAFTTEFLPLDGVLFFCTSNVIAPAVGQ